MLLGGGGCGCREIELSTLPDMGALVLVTLCGGCAGGGCDWGGGCGGANISEISVGRGAVMSASPSVLICEKGAKN